MKIFIQLPKSIISLDIEDDCTINEVKDKIKPKLNIDNNHRFYLFKGGLLRDDKHLSDYNIEDGNTLTSSIKSLPIRKILKISIKTLCGKNTSLKVKPSNKISEIKSLYQDEEGIPTFLQKYFYKGNELKDNKTLAECNIKSNTQINMVIKYRQ